MTALGASAAPRFQVEIPEGWHGLDYPRPDVALEIVADDPAGFDSRLSIETFATLPGTDGEAPPIVELIGARVDLLREMMTDALFLDMARYEHASGEVGLVATVAYRHGIHTVTALLWALPVGDGAVLATGLTNTDLIAVDAPEFAAIVASLRFGEAIDPALDALPFTADTAESASAERSQPLPPPAEGWLDESVAGDARLLRRLVDAQGSTVPAVISVMRALDVPGDLTDHHVAALEELEVTMTDPDLQQSGADPLAVGEMHRSSLVFRQGQGARVADLWTGDPKDGVPIVIVMSDFDDPAGRARAVAWVRGASRAELCAP